LIDDIPAAPRSGGRGRNLRLVQATAETLRELILSQDCGAQIGSLPELAAKLDVGIVTVQQAARILEHEGLLEVRRGPGGGYFGVRPDGAALERSVAAYLRVHGEAYRDVADMMSLLDTELLPAAACCDDESLRRELKRLLPRIHASEGMAARIELEEEIHRVVFRMVERPLFELLARVTTQVARRQAAPPLFPGAEGEAFWKQSRGRIVQAILDRDPGLAMFEAVRYRQAMSARTAAVRGEAVHWASVLQQGLPAPAPRA
jgi:DNA-binding FadR family transcriptional regulator